MGHGAQMGLQADERPAAKAGVDCGVGFRGLKPPAPSGQIPQSQVLRLAALAQDDGILGVEFGGGTGHPAGVKTPRYSGAFRHD